LEKRRGDREMGRISDWEIGRLCDKMSCVFASLREGDFERGRKGEWVILKLRITNYDLRNGEFGEATGRQGEWENG